MTTLDLHFNSKKHLKNQKKFKIRYYTELKRVKKILKSGKNHYGRLKGLKKLKLYKFLYNFE